MMLKDNSVDFELGILRQHFSDFDFMDKVSTDVEEGGGQWCANILSFLSRDISKKIPTLHQCHLRLSQEGHHL